MKSTSLFALVLTCSAAPTVTGEALYNGIALPDKCPTQNAVEAIREGDPMPVLWLEQPGQPVKIRFTLKSGALNLFCVNPDANGASHGFVAAGGPGSTRATDTVGNAASK